MGQCSTVTNDVEAFDPDMPVIDDRPGQTSICSDDRPRPSSAGSPADEGESREQPPRPDSAPPTCTGIVSDMIDNIFRSVLVSIETNDVALGLGQLCVGNRAGAHLVRPTPSARPSRPAAAVRKTRVISATLKRNLPLKQKMRRGIANEVPDPHPFLAPRLHCPAALPASPPPLSLTNRCGAGAGPSTGSGV